jgi:hypothetical protein
VNPKLLIIVEGLDYANNLSFVAGSPMKLHYPHQLVYEAHVYEWDYPVDSYESYAQVLDEAWGFIARQEIAPVSL